MPEHVPLVRYLALGDEPQLLAQACDSCGAKFFDQRDACASCFATSFSEFPVSREGIVRTFTIVSFAAPGVPVPFVSAVVDCDGVSVKANVINTDPTPENIRFGMPVRLATYSLGADDNGVEAIGFGFEPINVSQEVPA